MDKVFMNHLMRIMEKIMDFLPSFFAGVLLVLFGLGLGWFAKRVVIQLSMILHLERYLARFRWGQDFSKADVRFGFYKFLGNISYLIVFLIFLDNALTYWNLTFLSTILERALLLFPKIAMALIIFGFGIILAHWASQSVQRTLRRESIPRATLTSQFVKVCLILLFSAMALIELDIARIIVIIGFATIIITLGILSIVITIMGGKELIKSIEKKPDEE